jgi:homoserine kinase
LGSSAAALVAGLLAADRLLGLNLSDAARYSHAWRMEGHGDNVGAAHYGGAVLAVPGVPEAVRLWPRPDAPGIGRGEGRGERGVRPLDGASANGQVMPGGSPRFDTGRPAAPAGPLHGLTVVVFIPEVTGATWAARAALPAHVPHPDAAHNVATASGLTVGLLTGERALLAAGMHDRLHEPYRARLFPHLVPMAEAARAAGAIGACLSGAGPTVLALATPAAAPAVAAAVSRVAAALGTIGGTSVLAPVANGAHIVGDDPSFGCRTAVGSATASLA